MKTLGLLALLTLAAAGCSQDPESTLREKCIDLAIGDGTFKKTKAQRAADEDFVIARSKALDDQRDAHKEARRKAADELNAYEDIHEATMRTVNADLRSGKLTQAEAGSKAYQARQKRREVHNEIAKRKAAIHKEAQNAFDAATEPAANAWAAANTEAAALRERCGEMDLVVPTTRGLMHAILTGETEKVVAVLEAGADPNAFRKDSEVQLRPIHVAARDERTHVV